MEKRLKVSDIVVKGRHRKRLGDLKGLARSIKELGLLQAVGVTKKDRRLIYGERRLKAVEMNGDSEIDCRILDIENILKAEHAENEFQKALTPSEKHALAEELKREVRERSGRPAGARKDSPRKGEKGGPKGPPKPRGKVRDQVAKKAGFSSTTQMRRVSEVMEKGPPELVDAVDKGEVSIRAAAELTRGRTKEQQLEVLGHSRRTGDRVVISEKDHTAGDLLGSMVGRFVAFRDHALQHWPADGGEPDYLAMLKSSEHDSKEILKRWSVLKDHIGNLQRLFQAMTVFAKGVVKEAGFTPRQVKVLQSLKNTSERGRQLDRAQLAKATGIRVEEWSKLLGSATKGVKPDTLEGKGLVRSMDVEGQRGLLYVITPKGREALDRLAETLGSGVDLL